jgi:hypothetical protein
VPPFGRHGPQTTQELRAEILARASSSSLTSPNRRETDAWTMRDGLRRGQPSISSAARYLFPPAETRGLVATQSEPALYLVVPKRKPSDMSR